jgi:hypothetical protein
MGTRSLTFVYDENSKPIIKLYRQFDGYPSGHGLELAEFLNSIEEITNGIRAGDRDRRTANGMGCLAAQMVSHFKKGVGEFYLHNVEGNDHWQDYEYHVYKHRVVVKTHDDTVLFDDNWAEFGTFCKKNNDY